MAEPDPSEEMPANGVADATPGVDSTAAASDAVASEAAAVSAAASSDDSAAAVAAAAAAVSNEADAAAASVPASALAVDTTTAAAPIPTTEQFPEPAAPAVASAAASVDPDSDAAASAGRNSSVSIAPPPPAPEPEPVLEPAVEEAPAAVVSPRFTPIKMPPPPPSKRTSAIVTSATGAAAITTAAIAGAASTSSTSPPTQTQRITPTASATPNGSGPINPSHLSKPASPGGSANGTGSKIGSGQWSSTGSSVGSGQFSGSGVGSGQWTGGSGSGQFNPAAAAGGGALALGKLVIKQPPLSNNSRSAANLLASQHGAAAPPVATSGSATNLLAGTGTGGGGGGSGSYITEVHRTAHVSYDPSTGQYSGLPKEWEAALRKQFGLPCNKVEGVWVAGYDHRIPFVLVELRKQLVASQGMVQEGIFRVAPDAVACAAVKKQLDSGTFKTCNDPHTCSNLIKVWFRDLPSHILAVDPETLNSSAADGGDEKQTVARVIGALPEPNRSIVSWLLDLCCDVVAHEKYNKMTPKATAIVMSPNLYKLPPIGPQTTAAESLKLIDLQKRVNSFFEKAINVRLGMKAAAASGSAAAAAPLSPKAK